MVGQRGDIRGIGIHVVAGKGLRRAAMTAAVVGDHPKSVHQEEQHLVVPVVRRQGPAMVEHDRRCVFRSPVLVEDVRSVLGGDMGHGNVSLVGGAANSGIERAASPPWRSPCPGLVAASGSNEAARSLQAAVEEGPCPAIGQRRGVLVVMRAAMPGEGMAASGIGEDIDARIAGQRLLDDRLRRRR
jgi:hypothetical protein